MDVHGGRSSADLLIPDRCIGALLEARAFRQFLETAALPRSRESDAGLHHAVGLHVVRSIPHYLGRKSPGRNPLVRSPFQRRVGLPGMVHLGLPFLRSLLPTADALRQEASRAASGLGDLDDYRPHRRRILDRGAGLPPAWIIGLL